MLTMGIKNVQVIEETPYGIYVWQMPNGALVQDEDGNYLNVAAVKGDVRKINALKAAAASYGLHEGRPMWLGGHRQVTHEEWEDQRKRLEWGLIPDEWDLPAIKEDIEQKRKMGLM